MKDFIDQLQQSFSDSTQKAGKKVKNRQKVRLVHYN